MDPASGQLVGGGVQAQTRQVGGVEGQSLLIQLLISFIVLGVIYPHLEILRAGPCEYG